MLHYKCWLCALSLCMSDSWQSWNYYAPERANDAVAQF